MQNVNSEQQNPRDKSKKEDVMQRDVKLSGLSFARA